jgi:hypothetical protein
VADLAGISNIVFPGATSVYTNPNVFLDGATKQNIQAINQSTGAKTTVTMKKNDVTAIDGQSNDLPDNLFPDAPTLADTYRNGDITSTNPELFNPRTLASNDGEQVASMTLAQPVQSSQITPGTVNVTSYQGVTFINAYTRFFLQAVTEAEQEKYQIVETFTGFYSFFFGKRPPIYRYSGVLLSDPNYRWNNDFKFVYENFFRGTSAVEFAAEVIMAYNGRVITGFPLSLTMSQEAANDKGMPFSMDLLVVSHDVILSQDVAAVLAAKQLELSTYRNAIGVQQAKLKTGAQGPGAQIALQGTNGVMPPSSVISSNDLTSKFGNVSQLGLV